MRNIVNRVTLNLHFTNEEQAFRIRQQFAASSGAQIAGIIDEVCSQHLQTDQVLQIDQLHVDVGRLNAYAAYPQFADVFRQHFTQALLQRMAVIDPAAMHVQQAVNQLGILQHFLLTGALPWYITENEVDLPAITNEVLANSAGDLQRFLRGHKQNVQLWQRIGFQCSKQVHADLINELAELAEAVVAATIRLKALVTETETEITGKILPTLLPTIHKIVIQEAPLIFASLGHKQVIDNVIAKHVAQLLTAGNWSPEQKENLVNEFTQFHKGTGAATEKQTNADILQQVFAERKPVEEEYRVYTAGLLLLSPFLQRFFHRLQLMDKTNWQNNAAQAKAVYLLYYLSTGNVAPPEYSLVLEKIFCGLPVGWPIEPPEEFSQAELNECDDLLHSVIEHWKALKNTSIAGLRQAFLQRDAVLTQTTNGFLVRVERKTHDVLLDSLPWGYSSIALSWLPYQIHTEW